MPPNAAGFRPAKTGRHNVGAHQDLLVGQPVRFRREIDHDIGHQQVFRLRAIDGVAKAPPAERLPTMSGSGPTLSMKPQKWGTRVTRWGYRASNNALAFLIPSNGGSKLLNDADGVMTDSKAAPDRIFALQNVNIRPANGRGGYADKGVERANIRYRLALKDDTPRLNEYGSFHCRWHVATLSLACGHSEEKSHCAQIPYNSVKYFDLDQGAT
jgi:hypothetical protein